MKNKKSLLGALALSAALVVGTALPAFAADQGQANVGSGTGSETSVSIATYNDGSVSPDQVSVTVPLSMTIVARTAGGDLMTPNGYKITNNSSVNAVKVTPAYSMDNSSFNLLLTDKDDDIQTKGAYNDAPTGYDGYLKMTLLPSGYTVSDQSTTTAAKTKEGLWTVYNNTDVPTWDIAKGSSLTVNVSGETSKLGKEYNEASAAPQVLTLSYTVSNASL